MTATGTIFEGFRLLRPLGKGWLGQVFAAQNLDGGQVQALRIISPDLVAQPQVMTQFRRLYTKWQRLNNPNILTPYELVEREQHVLYSMALAQSGSVRQLLQSQAREGQFMDLLVAVDIARQVAGALAYAHEQNLMHGNLKPENLLLTPARALLGRQAYGVLVSDFGVAELQAFTHGVHDRQIITTPAYMSPEQCRGVRTEVRTDIYSLGVILYELLTNLVPFETKEFAEAMDKHLHVAPIPPGQIRLDIPADLEEIVLTCMAKTPEYRYRSAGELEEALQRVINGLLPQGPRPTVVLPDIPEPPVPRIEPLRDRVPYHRVQVCDANGQLIRVESLKADSATVGRAPSNAIVLEHAGVSRHHLSLEVTGGPDEPAVYVTDLGSTNGTTMSGAALLARERTVWPDGGVLRIEPFWLRLQPPQRVVQQARIGVLVEDNDIQLIPGEAVTLKVNLANTGKTVDHFRLEVEGVPDKWVHNLYHELQLNPGTTGETTLKVLVPRESEAHAKVYPVKIIARSRENPAEFGFAPMKWDVQPFVDTKSEFSPLRRSAWRRTHYDLKLVNTSNVPITYHPTVKDDEGEVKLQSPLDQMQIPAAASGGNLANLIPIRAIVMNTWLRLREGVGKVRVDGLPPEVTLQPGETFNGKVNVRLPIRWIAAPRNRNLQFHPNPEVGPDHPAKLSLLHLPLIPLWALPLVLLLGFLLFMWLMQAPNIVSVTVDPQRPLAGQPFTLRFETQNATRIHVMPFDKTLFARKGTLLIPQGIKEPTDVQVVVYGRIKTAEKTLQISPKMPDPVIKVFSVTPPNITAGQRAVVRWEVTNVKEITLAPLGTVPAKGEQSVVVTQDTNFQLQAGSGDQSVNKTIPVKVLPAEIEFFTVTPEQADMGQQVTIHWRVLNAESVTIDPIGSVPNQGQIKKPVTGDQTYTIKAQVGSQTLTRSVQIKVNPPQIESFTVTPEDAKVGDRVVVAWTVTHATSVAIDPLGPVGLSGRQAYVLTGPTPFKITASNGSTSVEASKTINATARQPMVGKVGISPSAPVAGKPFTLTWNSKDAVSVELDGLPSGTLSLPASGSKTIIAPDSPTTLTLTVTGSDGSVQTKSFPLQVKSPPIIAGGGGGGGGGGQPPKPQVNIGSFNADKTNITAGQSVTLRWNVTGVQEVKVFPPGNPLSANGNLTVSPGQTTVYTLVAGDKNQRITITVKPKEVAPVVKIVSFNADRTSITAGQSVTLRWNVSGTQQARLTPPGANQAASGRLTVSPTKTTTYTLTAGGQQDTVTVTVKPAAPTARIVSFNVDKTTITAGQSVTLRWNVTGSSDVKVFPPGTPQAASGSLTLSPTQDTTYTLVAGGQRQSVEVNVKPAVVATPVVIQSFSSVRTSVTAGESTTLIWKVTGTPRVRLLPLGRIMGAESALTVKPTKTTTYTLVAGDQRQNVTVTVTPVAAPKADIVNFSANRTNIKPGDTVTLTWKATGVNQVQLLPMGTRSTTENSLTVKPQQTTTYTLVAGDQRQTVTVTVTAPPRAQIINFSANRTSIVAGQVVMLSWKATGVNQVQLLPTGNTSSAENVLSVKPQQTTTYTLVAGDQRQTVTVTVTQPAKPQILSFSANRTSIKPGDTVTLTWKASGVNQVQLLPMGAHSTAENSLAVKPQQTTTYTLVAGDQRQNVTVTVTAPEVIKPQIISFTANHTTIKAGESVVLSWKARGVSQVRLLPAGNAVTAENSVALKPQQTTTYTLVAGDQRQNVTVTVMPADNNPNTVDNSDVVKPVITTFQASETEVAPGTEITLTWQTQAAKSVSLQGKIMRPNDQVTRTIRQDTTFTLIATNGNQRVQQSITIRVK